MAKNKKENKELTIPKELVILKDFKFKIGECEELAFSNKLKYIVDKREKTCKRDESIEPHLTDKPVGPTPTYDLFRKQSSKDEKFFEPYIDPKILFDKEAFVEYRVREKICYLLEEDVIESLEKEKPIWTKVNDANEEYKTIVLDEIDEASDGGFTDSEIAVIEKILQNKCNKFDVDELTHNMILSYTLPAEHFIENFQESPEMLKGSEYVANTLLYKRRTIGEKIYNGLKKRDKIVDLLVEKSKEQSVDEVCTREGFYEAVREIFPTKEDYLSFSRTQVQYLKNLLAVDAEVVGSLEENLEEENIVLKARKKPVRHWNL